MINKSNLISVCCSCNKVKIDGRWQERPDLLILYKDNLSHGICSSCAERLYPSIYKKSQKLQESFS